jgi:hypothetical protein
MRIEYEGRIPREGTCGPTLVAFLTGLSVEGIISEWTGKYHGYCSLRELERELNKYKIPTSRIKAFQKHEYDIGDNQYAVAKIIWSKKYVNWSIPEKNTHFIFLGIIRDELWIYDNTAGWFKPDSNTGMSYLEHGKLTNLLVI